MAHDVFVSYSDDDRLIADKVCAALEGTGIRCWIAHRNNLAGIDWDEQIVDAITRSQILVLVCSSRADTSPQVKREVACAVSKQVAVLPCRIEDVPLKALEYFLSTPHWLDASTPPLEKHLPHLVETVQQLLAAKGKPASPEPVQPEPPTDTRSEAAVRVALLYKRNAQPDEQVLRLLETQLSIN